MLQYLLLLLRSSPCIDYLINMVMITKHSDFALLYLYSCPRLDSQKAFWNCITVFCTGFYVQTVKQAHWFKSLILLVSWVTVAGGESRVILTWAYVFFH